MCHYCYLFLFPPSLYNFLLLVIQLYVLLVPGLVVSYLLLGVCRKQAASKFLDET